MNNSFCFDCWKGEIRKSLFNYWCFFRNIKQIAHTLSQSLFSFHIFIVSLPWKRKDINMFTQKHLRVYLFFKRKMIISHQCEKEVFLFIIWTTRMWLFPLSVRSWHELSLSWRKVFLKVITTLGSLINYHFSGWRALFNWWTKRKENSFLLFIKQLCTLFRLFFTSNENMFR